MTTKAVLMKPAQFAESNLMSSILDGTYPPGSNLPSERDLAVMLNVTRPTLRETIGRLAREGWLTIHQGKPTRVNDFMWDGGLGILKTMANYSEFLTPATVNHILQVRDALMPEVARMASETHPKEMEELLTKHEALPDSAEEWALFDWELQLRMAHWSENPVFTMIFNDFESVYLLMAGFHFRSEKARRISRDYYRKLLYHLRMGAPGLERTVRETMRDVNGLWNERVADPNEESPV